MELHTFLKGISPNMNVTVCLEFKLIYFKSTVQHFAHYFMGNPPLYIAMYNNNHHIEINTKIHVLNLEKAVYITFCINSLGKYINMSILSLAMGK